MQRKTNAQTRSFISLTMKRVSASKMCIQKGRQTSWYQDLYYCYVQWRQNEPSSETQGLCERATVAWSESADQSDGFNRCVWKEISWNNYKIQPHGVYCGPLTNQRTHQGGFSVHSEPAVRVVARVADANVRRHVKVAHRDLEMDEAAHYNDAYIRKSFRHHFKFQF